MGAAIAAAALVAGLGILPAAAEPVSIDAACQATRDALTTGGTAGDVVFAGQRWQAGSVIVDASGTYGLIAGEGLRTKDREAALRYLKAPGATAWFDAGRFPGQTYAQARQQATGLPADCAAAAGLFLSRSGSSYQYANATVILDDAGRIASWSNLAFTYGPQTVDLPAPVVPHAKWLRASQAASLNATMRTIARTVAGSATPDPAAIAASLRTYADPARAVPLKVRTLRAGALLYGRNPFTRTYHAWRVYVKDGTVAAKRVAP